MAEPLDELDGTPFRKSGNFEVISTGNSEIDKKMGGGIPKGSMTLIEGESDSGKSVLSQQMIWGSLYDGFVVTLYTSENTFKSFIKQMTSLSLDVSDFVLLRKLKIFAIRASKSEMTPEMALNILLASIQGYVNPTLVGGGLTDYVPYPHLHRGDDDLLRSLQDIL